MQLYDISPTLSEQTAVFPGDVKFLRETSLSFAAGHHLGLSSIQTTVHIGAHADAPSHYLATGAGIDCVSPAVYVGRCLVVRANRVDGEARDIRIGKRHLSNAAVARIESSPRVQRVLVATGSFPDPSHWNSDFASLEPRLIEWLAANGVVLVGIDTPSVDPESSKGLEAHAALARTRLAVLEGLCLQHVPEGEYFLSALPIKIENGDAGLVRAILIKGLDIDVAATATVVR